MTTSARNREGVRLRRLLSHSEDGLDGGQYVTIFRHTLNTMITTVICCPECSSKTPLSSAHRIDEEGYVTPAVKCSNGSCSWFEFVHLDGWGEPV